MVTPKGKHDGLFGFSKDDFTYLREVDWYITDLQHLPVIVYADNTARYPQAFFRKAAVKDNGDRLTFPQLGECFGYLVFHRISPSCAGGDRLPYPAHNGTEHPQGCLRSG